MTKPHMIEVPQSALTAMADRVIAGDLDVPHIIKVAGRWYADAGDMRLYSARTSLGDDAGTAKPTSEA